MNCLKFFQPKFSFYAILFSGTPDSSSLDDHALECTSQVEKANCKMIEGQCWCFHEGGIPGYSVCGYPEGYNGEYYSIATDSKPSPHTIIKAFGKTPSPRYCKLDTMRGCWADSQSNICVSAAWTNHETECYGMHFHNQSPVLPNKYRWDIGSSPSIVGGFVRCKDIEGKLSE